MTRLISHISVSLDGYAAGPDQSPDAPLGVGGERLHDWATGTEGWREQHGLEGGERNVDSEIARTMLDGAGACIMGRNMFGGGPGPWDASWKGWWGDEPPFRMPVFVLTHHARPSLEMTGGTTFHFVTGGIDAALQRARAAAGEGDVVVAGGAQTVRQYLAAGLLDELCLHIAQVILGGGERLLDDVGTPALRQVEVVGSPATAIHARYRVVR